MGEEWIAASRAFIRDCLASTPLRDYQRLFEGDRGQADGAEDLLLMEGLEQFRTDLARYQLSFDSPEDLFAHLLLAPNLQATYFYRTCHAFYKKDVACLPDVIATVSRLLTGIEIYYSADIGPGLKLIHGTGTVIGSKCKIGSHFTIYQNVTIGDKLGREMGKRPVIGDYVIVSAGAKIFGPVTVGSKTIIGANAVVIDSLPDRCIAAGLPARVKVAGLSEEQFSEFFESIRR
jgi:serine O-acetyltransferase